MRKLLADVIHVSALLLFIGLAASMVALAGFFLTGPTP